MRRLAFALILLQVSVLPLFGADAPKECSLCAGVIAAEGAGVPTLWRLAEADLATWSPTRPGEIAVVVDYAIDSAKDAPLQIEEHTKTIIDWARAHGPFDSLGVSITGADSTLTAYAIKRLAVSAQGLDVAKGIVVEAASLAPLYENEAGGYFDAVLVDAPKVAETLVWLAERDPSKKIFATVAIESPNALFDLAKALSAGASRAYASTAVDANALVQFNRAMSGDWAYDSTAKISVLDAKGNAAEMPVLSFVRGEDLRTMLVPRGDAAAPMILSLPADRFTKPRRVDAVGEREITDTGRKGNRLLVGSPAVKQPFAVVVDYTEKPDRNVTKETISVATERGISVEEVIRNHQAYDAYQETIEPRYIARNTTKLRFDIGGGAEALEATIAGDYFSDRDARADWVWQDFLLNGVKWKYGRIPELPLIQPEKVSQLPLDIHLTNEYRYQLVRQTDVLGYRTYEVRFEPPRSAPAELPLYRGTVWIDVRTWARIRIVMVQLNLTGEVLSNEERVDFVPFSRTADVSSDTRGRTGTSALLPAEAAKVDPRALIWLPYEVGAQQVISAAGRTTVVQRSTTFTNFRLDPQEFETLLAQASASDARMVRETASGMRYLEKRGDGERVVKEGFDSSRLFALGGVHHDAGLEFPVVPLGGIDYFNFNLFDKGIQTNVFFAGVVLAANATHPDVGGTRTNVGADLFGIAIPVQNTMYRGGVERAEEAVKSLPMSLTVRAGHPVLQFGKIDVSLGVAHFKYSRGEETDPNFLLPPDTFVISPSISAQYARHGYSVSGFFDFNRRSEWSPWGNLAEYSEDQKNFSRFGGSLGKSFYLPKFQRIGVDLNYLDGQHLDRFSKYELGFFGSQRVHGVKSGSVRAERAIIGHLSYGFVFSQQFRLEAFYDHALIDDASAGFEREPFQGVGIAGQTIGPYGTLLRLDVGKMIGRNAQDGFVANVVVLKLF
ncbi:MAG TPA: hypothetical protein VNA69_06950 [Thermoanaerobaculia bacterium]|nr:hypothetical protein [Thermoanaerobaculia bacterium]